MKSHCFHDTVRRVKDMAMNELPGRGVFFERTVDDWIHGYNDAVTNLRVLLFKFKYINGNKVQ